MYVLIHCDLKATYGLNIYCCSAYKSLNGSVRGSEEYYSLREENVSPNETDLVLSIDPLFGPNTASCVQPAMCAYYTYALMITSVVFSIVYIGVYVCGVLYKKLKFLHFTN